MYLRGRPPTGGVTPGTNSISCMTACVPHGPDGVWACVVACVHVGLCANALPKSLSVWRVRTYVLMYIWAIQQIVGISVWGARLVPSICSFLTLAILGVCHSFEDLYGYPSSVLILWPCPHYI